MTCAAETSTVHYILSCGLVVNITDLLSCLGGVMLSMLATGPKVHRFKPGQGDGLIRVINIRSTPSF
jgi:hypothetical protein